MKLLVPLLALIAALAFTSGTARADLIQTIRVHVESSRHVTVDGRPLPMEALTAAVAERVRGDKRIRIEIYVPLGTRRRELEPIMARCRKAGASSFKVFIKA